MLRALAILSANWYYLSSLFHIQAVASADKPSTGSQELEQLRRKNERLRSELAAQAAEVKRLQQLEQARIKRNMQQLQHRNEELEQRNKELLAELEALRAAAGAGHA